MDSHPDMAISKPPQPATCAVLAVSTHVQYQLFFTTHSQYFKHAIYASFPVERVNCPVVGFQLLACLFVTIALLHHVACK